MLPIALALILVILLAMLLALLPDAITRLTTWTHRVRWEVVMQRTETAALLDLRAHGLGLRELEPILTLADREHAQDLSMWVTRVRTEVDRAIMRSHTPANLRRSA